MGIDDKDAEQSGAIPEKPFKVTMGGVEYDYGDPERTDDFLLAFSEQSLAVKRLILDEMKLGHLLENLPSGTEGDICREVDSRVMSFFIDAIEAREEAIAMVEVLKRQRREQPESIVDHLHDRGLLPPGF